MSLGIRIMYFDGRPFTRAQAAAEGWTDSQLRKQLRDGLIRRLLRGVYVDALAADTLELRAAAVCLVTAPDAIICRRTAAWLYGIDTLALREYTELPDVDSVRPPMRRSSRVSLTSGHSQTLHEGDVIARHGLRVTSPLATAVHLARHLDRPFALSAVDAMLHAGLFSAAQLRAAVRRYPGHPGIVQARELASYAEPLTESPGESWLRLRVIDAGFPRPEAQVVVQGPGGERRIDLGFPYRMADGRRLGLEYDSDKWHSGAAADERDESRRSELAHAGWLILPVRRGNVWGRDPQLELAIGEYLGIEPRLPRRW
ncbi:MAG TPA: type IV toxin-antitoxin system AbiEi family antitoxin domain-containing protein [Kribbella sp.]|nr:type IV toxin-antitoxin system AbiEi family antitoxin domain-containing protein [Kribbella sp.]